MSASDTAKEDRARVVTIAATGVSIGIVVTLIILFGALIVMRGTRLPWQPPAAGNELSRPLFDSESRELFPGRDRNLFPDRGMNASSAPDRFEDCEFHFSDFVEITKGFYKGAKGIVSRKTELGYTVTCYEPPIRSLESVVGGVYHNPLMPGVLDDVPADAMKLVPEPESVKGDG